MGIGGLVIVCLTVLLVAALAASTLVILKAGATAAPDAAPLLAEVEHGQRVAVYVGEGQALRGRFEGASLGVVSLADAEFVGETATRLGTVRVPEATIAFVQLLAEQPVAQLRHTR